MAYEDLDTAGKRVVDEALKRRGVASPKDLSLQDKFKTLFEINKAAKAAILTRTKASARR